MVGDMAGAEVLVGVGEEAGLDGVTPMLGAGLGTVCLTVILMEDMDLVIPTAVMVHHSPMVTTHSKGA